VEIVVAEVGQQPSGDQIYRITFDGSVTDEPGFVAFGGQADQVSAELKERYSDGMSLAEAFGAALSALSAPGNGDGNEVVAAQLEVAILDRTRDHRTFRRIRTTRLEELISESRAITAPADSQGSGSAESGSSAESSAPAESGPPIGPDASSSDRGSGTPPNPL
jgi:proteasome alpha subunit